MTLTKLDNCKMKNFVEKVLLYPLPQTSVLLAYLTHYSRKPIGVLE